MRAGRPASRIPFRRPDRPRRLVPRRVVLTSRQTIPTLLGSTPLSSARAERSPGARPRLYQRSACPFLPFLPGLEVGAGENSVLTVALTDRDCEVILDDRRPGKGSWKRTEASTPSGLSPQPCYLVGIQNGVWRNQPHSLDHAVAPMSRSTGSVWWDGKVVSGSTCRASIGIRWISFATSSAGNNDPEWPLQWQFSDANLQGDFQQADRRQPAHIGRFLDRRFCRYAELGVV